MVRLRREIEGIRPDLSVLAPVWSGHQEADELILPQWEQAIAQAPMGRVLVCGRPELRWVRLLADRGDQVTCCDLDKAQARSFASQLSPEQSGKVQLVDKSYGEASFSPSSFDLIITCDQLHRYPTPSWVVRKMQRELKVDGVMLARLAVFGDSTLSESQRELAERSTAPDEGAAVTLWVKMHDMFASGHRPTWLNRPGREALERSALSHHVGQPLGAQLDAIEAHVTLEQVVVGHPARVWLARLLRYGRAPLRALARASVDRIPTTQTQRWADTGDARAAMVQARRALTVGGNTLRFN